MELIKIDLDKAHKHNHPDIIPDTKTYLVKVHGAWHAGKFSKQWYGLNFDNWGTSGLQFDAPGWNSSQWEQVWEIIEE